MVGRPLKIGATLMIALLSLSGLAVAQPLALVTGDGGGQAQGQVHGDYHADANGALDAADERQADAREKLSADVHNANSAASETKWTIYEQLTEVQTPQRPQCQCSELFERLEQAGELKLSHADRVQKAADVESEYVDAGADVGASGQAEAFLTDAFEGSEELFDRVKGALGFETDVREDAEDAGEQVLRSEGELRGQIVQQTDQDVDLPDPDPRVEGSTTAQHATEVTSSAAGNGQAGVP